LFSCYWPAKECSVFDPETLALAKEALAQCRARNWRVATAESCTGGLVAAALTAIPGASDVFERSFITYSNPAKMELLGVPPETIVTNGAISAEAAEAMARGALSHAPVDLAVSVTGIAGPGGGTSQKPVGLVYLGLASKDGLIQVERRNFAGGRAEIRDAALLLALALLRDASRPG
jgi:nicotinamide-nucleotide amidase